MAVDFFARPVWLVFGLAVLLLTPLTSGAVRKWVLAALNLMLIVTILWSNPFMVRASQVKLSIALIVGVGLAWASLRLIRRAGKPGLAACLCSIGLLAVWLLHKLPHLAQKAHLDRFSGLLVTVGFSYAALRMVEAMRAMAERRHAAPDIADTINYLLPFNMLAAGPIQAYDDFVAQPQVPEPLTFKRTLACAERIVNGLFKKYALALTLQRLFLTDWRSHGLYLLLVESQIYYVWLYLDFSAYSDIAVGMGGLLGIATPENFNRPYLARNVIDFWERWHISLSQFIRRNVFLPLQLFFVRRSEGSNALGAACLAFAISFTLCGLWHNVSVRWLFWGAIQASGLIVCYLYRHILLKRHGRKWVNAQVANPVQRAISIVLTFEFAALSVAATMYQR
jgi:D-alanyl-lipoteichoic acid acyltransferase DltB (MBOAT superfamily)